MRNLIIISLCAVILTLASCSKENVLVEKPIPGTGETTLSATFAHGGEGAVTAAEWKIDGVRMIVFSLPRPGQGSSQVVRNTYKPGATPTFNEIVPVGYIDIYLIANELGASAGAENWNLEDVTNIEELESKIAKYTNHPVVSESRPIPMCARYQNVKIDLNGTMTQNGTSLSLNNVKLKRIIAKTTLNLGCVFANLPDGGQSLTLESVQIKRMPKFSHLAPDHNYSGVADEDLINGTPASISEVVYQYGNPLAPTKKTGFTAKFSCYLPEYLPSDASKYTYFDIVASPDGNPSVKLRYKLIIGDGIDDGHGNRKDNAQMAASVKSSDFNVSRNTHYIFETQIKSYGTVDGMIVDPTVEPWGDPKEVDEDLKGHILNVSDIQVSITDISSARIYFWSNQKDVAVDLTGYTGATGTATFTVNSFFDKIAGVGAAATNFHYEYNPATQSGTGYMDIHTTRSGQGNYAERIFLNANGLKREIKITSIIPTPPVPWSTYPWVGTFHRSSETGERVIYSGHTGEWSATVEYAAGVDPFVVLSRTSSLDAGIKTDNPGEAEDHQILAGKQSVSGKGNIFFRVGLTSKLASAATQPRYAKIRVNWKNGTQDKVTYMYVRQGEAPAIIKSGTTVRWSPYNLKAANYNGAITNRGGQFTDYPTKAGSYFMWNTLWAYAPVGAPIDWGSQINQEYLWKTSQEPCPSSAYSGDALNYRTPSDSDDIPSLTVSLPHSDGYYADGYFDRRIIGTQWSLVGDVNYENSAVGMNTNEVAYKGKLGYNNATNASIFMPHAGFRHQTGGSLMGLGFRGDFWATGIGMTVNYGGSSFNQNNMSVVAAVSVRCIVQE